MPLELPRRVLADFVRVLPQFVAYEVVTRLIMAAVVLPLFTLATSLLLASQGIGAVTNATLGPFLASWQGITFVVLLLGLVVWGLIAEVGGSITIAAANRTHTTPTSYTTVLRHALGRAPNLLSVGGVLLLIYAAVALPLTGFGVNTTVLQDIAVPTFILSVILGTPAFLIGYLAVLALLGALAILLSYTFPLIIVGDLRAWAAIRTSVRLVTTNPRAWWHHYGAPSLLASLAVSVVVGAWFGLVTGTFALLRQHEAVLLPLGVFLLLVQNGAALFGSMLLIPFGSQRLVAAYYASLPAEGPLAALAASGPDLPARQKRSLLDRAVSRPGRLGLGLVAGMAALALPLGYAANDLVHDRTRVLLVGHRAGGFGAPENSLAGLSFAHRHGADLVEVDVQRTADGHYVLNHDETFRRVAGVNRASSEMTLAEVRELRIQGSTERVPTVEEFLTAAHAIRMPVVLELKGATADEQMADDMVALADRLDMRERVVLMSLDYRLVAAIERKNPDVVTGFAYFLAIGNAGTLASDLAFMEEGEATSARLTDVLFAGKQSYVWTVNDGGAMATLALRGVDAIITDEVAVARRVLDEHNSLSSAEILQQLFWGA